MDNDLHIEVKCPSCGHSLMHPAVEIDGLPSIRLGARVNGRTGHIYLSQVYGSYDKQFAGVPDVLGSIAALSCPHCQAPLPVARPCICQAPMVELYLRIGGAIRFCTRNGCKKHALEFEDPDEMFTLFECQRE